MASLRSFLSPVLFDPSSIINSLSLIGHTQKNQKLRIKVTIEQKFAMCTIQFLQRLSKVTLILKYRERLSISVAIF